jgi:hypothetical protein
MMEARTPGGTGVGVGVRVGVAVGVGVGVAVGVGVGVGVLVGVGVGVGVGVAVAVGVGVDGWGEPGDAKGRWSARSVISMVTIANSSEASRFRRFAWAKIVGSKGFFPHNGRAFVWPTAARAQG